VHQKRGEIVWSGVRSGVRRLPFASVTSYAEAQRYHRYALMLRHAQTKFLERVPVHTILWVRWGEKWELRPRRHLFGLQQS
jgi:hypothetical protein